MNEPNTTKTRHLPPKVPQTALFPYEMKQPLNEYSDGTMVFRIRADKIPKCEILQINTLKGQCYIRMSEVERAPIYEQVFKIPTTPLQLKQVVLRPITREQKERLENDRYAMDNPQFIRELLQK